MEKVEYLIVGDGFAGLFFAHQLLKDNKSFKIFSEGKQGASHISAGVCNPIVLKRFTKMWNAEPQMQYLQEIFKEIEAYLGKNYLIAQPVVRLFHDAKERETWLKKAQDENLKNYLSTNLLSLPQVKNPYGAAEVKDTCRLDVGRFFQDYFSYLKEANHLITAHFDYEALNLETKTYHDLAFDKIVFAEGISVSDNPYFQNLPVRPNKGHRLAISLDQTLESYTYKKRHFLFPLAGNEYFYGATYDRHDNDLEVHQEKVEELTTGLEETYPHPYKINKVYVGFRATVSDRRPILGRHPLYPFLYVLNGLGSRGVLNGTYFSKHLYDYIENGAAMKSEVDVQRFYDKKK